jgi:hypothetical protein
VVGSRSLGSGCPGPRGPDGAREEAGRVVPCPLPELISHTDPANFQRDAAHACPPTLAQGAAQALEDAAVLTELLLGRPAVDDALWAAFTARRSERARTVVEASLQLGQWQLDHEQGNAPGLLATITALVSQPA